MLINTGRLRCLKLSEDFQLAANCGKPIYHVIMELDPCQQNKKETLK